jgi:hypothetical protein
MPLTAWTPPLPYAEYAAALDNSQVSPRVARLFTRTASGTVPLPPLALESTIERIDAALEVLGSLAEPDEVDARVFARVLIDRLRPAPSVRSHTGPLPLGF